MSGVVPKMDIGILNKKATILARAGNYNEAISLLKEAVSEMARTGGYSNGGYTKIIPYFQKAGKYQEGVDYSLGTLIPAVKNDCAIAYSHKCREIKESFTNHSISQIYDKLRLCAKREGNIEDEVFYAKLSEGAWREYERLLSVGERIELEKEFKEALKLYGASTSDWPSFIKKKFIDFIKR